MVLEIVGWVGSAMILIAYFLVSNGKLSALSSLYQWLNAVGSAGIIVHTFYYQAWPSFTLNVFWALIAIKALVDIRRRVPNAPLDR